MIVLYSYQTKYRLNRQTEMAEKMTKKSVLSEVEWIRSNHPFPTGML